jgi:multidrug transporter EmrE-like cation transporter
MLPTIVLVVYGQLIVKWRVEALYGAAHPVSRPLDRLAVYLMDPYILSAYAAAVGGSMTWMFVVENQPVSLAFPLYIGLTVALVVLGGIWLFGEPISPQRILAIALILAGVAIGSRS